ERPKGSRKTAQASRSLIGLADGAMLRVGSNPTPGVTIKKVDKMNIDRFIKLANNYGFILSYRATKFLEENISRIDEKDFIMFLKQHDKIIVEKEDIENLIKQKMGEEETSLVDIKENIEIIYNPSNLLNPGSISKSYVDMLRDRYRKLMVKIKRNISGLKPVRVIDISSRIMRNNEVLVVAYIYRRRIFEDRIIIEIEDESGTAVAYIFRKTDQKIYDTISKSPLDVVVGLRIFVTNKGKLIVKDVIPPKIRTKFQPKVGPPVYALLISDLHIGSKKFNYDVFERFIEITKGIGVGDQVKSIVRRLKYIVIAGDLVDGIGVYQGQEMEIHIPKIEDQYKEAYNLLKKVPGHIRIIIIPGNHDASRSALPQPPIFKNMAVKFYEDKQFLMLGNPANISLHGVNILVYHGDFIQDILTTTPGLHNGDIGLATNILLTYSHLAPQIGLSTKIAPEPRDHLIISDGIHVLHFGHTHRFNISRHMGVLTVNSGTFQEQTKYQKIMRIEPDIGYLTFLNLMDLNPQVVRILD
ncbi:TPA: hypothetical protein EYP83_00795, partial [Candidatus Geothermarchaeota archaeon]|nr:hypothetical protein [Candidatus Geothermarchaeota archaeon]